MITKAEVTAKLAELKAASLAPEVLKDGTEADMAALFQPVEDAIAAYYTGDSSLRYNVQYTINQLALDQVNRNMIYEHQERLPAFPSEAGAPIGYNDLGELFNGAGAIPEIMALGAAVFVSNFAYREDSQGGGESSSESPGEGTAGEKKEIPDSNPYLTAWAEQITGARKNEIAGLQSIASFCENGSYNAGLCMLFETLGEIIDSMKPAELTDRIYIAGGYKSVIIEMGINVYIPVAVRGDE